MKSLLAAVQAVALSSAVAFSAPSIATAGALNFTSTPQHQPVTSFEVASDGFDRTPLGRSRAAATLEVAEDGFDRTPIAQIS